MAGAEGAEGIDKGIRNGASYVASLRGGERQEQRLFYICLFFYVLLDLHVLLLDSWIK